MSWENELTTSLRDLDVPEHGPEFWAELETRLEESPNAGRRRRYAHRRWRMPVTLVAVAAAVLVVLTVALPTSLTSTVLAYSYPAGSYSYALNYYEATELDMAGEGSIVPGPDVFTEAVGTLTYTVAEDPGGETKTIEVRADISGGNDLDGPFRDIPEVRFVVDSDGGFVEVLTFPEMGVPGFVFLEALPGSSKGYAGLPFGFGPPFPDHPIDIGDTWTTSGPRGAFAENGPQFTAEHTVIGEETIVGRDTIVITSVYRTPAAEFDQRFDDMGDGSISRAVYGPETAEVTVWFDPAAGIIIRAELDSTTASETRFQNGQILTSISTTEAVVELTGER